MQFTFKRDDEGRERIYVGDVCVGTWAHRADISSAYTLMSHVPGATDDVILAVIERADEAGFWHQQETMPHRWEYIDNCVRVEVPVAETSTTLVVVREGDE